MSAGLISDKHAGMGSPRGATSRSVYAAAPIRDSRDSSYFAAPLATDELKPRELNRPHAASLLEHGLDQNDVNRLKLGLSALSLYTVLSFKPKLSDEKARG